MLRKNTVSEQTGVAAAKKEGNRRRRQGRVMAKEGQEGNREPSYSI